MKRGAVRQIQREDGEEEVQDVDGNDHEQDGAAAASQPVERVIRGLPKRKGLDGSTPSASVSPSSSSPSSFSFAPQQPSRPIDAPLPKLQFQPQATAASTSPLSSSPSSFSFGQAAKSTSAPASAGSSSSSLGFSFVQSDATSKAALTTRHQSPSASSSGGGAKSAGDSANSINNSITSKLDHLLALRGLNHSLRTTLASQLDPATLGDAELDDLAPLVRGILEKYESKRKELENQEAQGSSAFIAPPPLSSSSISSANVTTPSTTGFTFAPAPHTRAPSVRSAPAYTPSFPSSTPATTKSPEMPVFSAPAGGFFFAGKKTSDITAATANNSYQAPLPEGIPTFDKPISSFKFAEGSGFNRRGTNNAKKTDNVSTSGVEKKQRQDDEKGKEAQLVASEAEEFKNDPAAGAGASKLPAPIDGARPFSGFGYGSGFTPPPAATPTPSWSPSSSSAPAAMSTFGSSTFSVSKGSNGTATPAVPSTGFSFGNSFKTTNSQPLSTGFTFSPQSTTKGTSTALAPSSAPAAAAPFSVSSSFSPSASSSPFSTFANPNLIVNRPLLGGQGAGAANQGGIFDFKGSGGKISFGGEEQQKQTDAKEKEDA